MTTGPSSERRVTQERCSRDPLQVGDIVILKDPRESWTVIGFSWTAISHTLLIAPLEMSSDLRPGSGCVDDTFVPEPGGLYVLLWRWSEKHIAHAFK